jgi:hypothetical protein
VGEGTVQAMGAEGDAGWQLTALVVHTRGGPGGAVMVPIVKEADAAPAVTGP